MNYIKHLTGFFEKVVLDKTLNPTHVSLYMALFQFWNCNRFKNPISINRDEVMRISKISSKATYHKCLKNLHSLGYINYEPSYNPFKGSHVIMFNFSEELKPELKSERKSKNEPPTKPVIGQALNKLCTGNETSTEQAVVPSINDRNNTNLSNNQNVANLNEQTKKFEDENDIQLKNQNSKEEKSSAKKEEKIQPTIDEIKSYFKENNFPKLEAQKFFNYFTSVGWLVGGKTPMINWQAAAQNWIINSVNFNNNTETTQTNRPKHLNTSTDKNYAEPL
ncbi:MAG: transcriptional regulator [Flavobacterium sp.]|nr:transcriptional regulator [Flavobacterium sp.]